MATTTVDAKDIAGRLTIKLKVKHARQWAVRTWVAIQLIRLAAFIAWIGCDIEEVGTGKASPPKAEQ